MEKVTDMEFKDLESVTDMDILNLSADKIAELILSTDTDDRGLLFAKVAYNLKKQTNLYTGRLFDKIAKEYGEI